MTDKEIISNYLLLLKSEVEVYIHGTIESSNETSRKALKNGLSDILVSQEETFNIMVQNKFYDVENVKKSSIKKIYDKFN